MRASENRAKLAKELQLLLHRAVDDFFVPAWQSGEKSLCRDDDGAPPGGIRQCAPFYTAVSTLSVQLPQLPRSALTALTALDLQLSKIEIIMQYEVECLLSFHKAP